MRLQRKIGIGILIMLVVAVFHFTYIISEPMIGYAICDSIVHAAKQITPGQVLAAMCIISITSVLLVSFSTFLFDQIPHFKKRRIADQRKQDAEEITRWKARYGEEAAARKEAEAWRAQAEPILAAMRSSNRNLNAQASQVVKR